MSLNIFLKKTETPCNKDFFAAVIFFLQTISSIILLEHYQGKFIFFEKIPLSVRIKSIPHDVEILLVIMYMHVNYSTQ